MSLFDNISARDVDRFDLDLSLLQMPELSLTLTAQGE